MITKAVKDTNPPTYHDDSGLKIPSLGGYELEMAEYAEEASPGVSKEGITSRDEAVHLGFEFFRWAPPYCGWHRLHMLEFKDGRFAFINYYNGEDQGTSASFWMAISDSPQNLSKFVIDFYSDPRYEKGSGVQYIIDFIRPWLNG